MTLDKLIDIHAARYRAYFRAAANAERIGNTPAASRFLRLALEHRAAGKTLRLQLKQLPRKGKRVSAAAERVSCPFRLEPENSRLVINGQCTEIRTYGGRCLLRKPAHWPAEASALRWLRSGGETTVFGPCTPNLCRERERVWCIY